MASNTMKLLFLLSFSLFVASCGGDKDKESKSTTPTPSTKKPDPDQDDPVVPLTQKDKLDIGAETYALFQKIAKDDPKKMEEINKLLGAVDAIFKDQTTYDTLAKRDEAIDDLDIPNALGGMDVAAIRAALKTKLKADKDLPPGTASLKTFAKSGLAKEPVYNAIVQKGVNSRGTRSDAELNALMVAVQDAINANPNPNAAQTLVRNAAIEAAVVANGGATNGATDAAYKAEIIRVVNTEHPELLLDAAASRLAPLTHGAVANTAHPTLTVGQRNELMPLVLAAVTDSAHKFTTATRKAAVEAAVRNVRALGAAAFTAEDTALIDAIMAQLPGEYAIAQMTPVEAELRPAVHAAIVGPAAGVRTADHKNAIMLVVHANKAGVAVQLTRTNAIGAAVTQNGGGAATAAADTAYRDAILAPFELAYYPNWGNLAASGLDEPVFNAIGDYAGAGITQAHRTSLATAMKNIMNGRPRTNVGANARDTLIRNAVTALVGIPAGDVIPWATALIMAANDVLAQPIVELPALAATALGDNGVYEAITGASAAAAAPPVVIKASNDQMIALMGALPAVIDVRPRKANERNDAVDAAVLAVLGGAALDADGQQWATGIKNAIEAFQPAAAAPHVLKTQAASHLPLDVYNAVVGIGVVPATPVSNEDMNDMMDQLKAEIVDTIAAQPDRTRVTATRDGVIADAAVAATVGVGNPLTPAEQPWADAIKLAYANYMGADVVPPARVGAVALHADVFDKVNTDANAFVPPATNTKMTAFLNVLAAAVPKATHAERIADIRPAGQLFGYNPADNSMLREFNKGHGLIINAQITGTVGAAAAGGYMVQVTGSTNPDVTQNILRQWPVVFLPADMFNNLPIQTGDTVKFDSVNADAADDFVVVRALLPNAHYKKVIAPGVVNYTIPIP